MGKYKIAYAEKPDGTFMAGVGKYSFFHLTKDFFYIPGGLRHIEACMQMLARDINKMDDDKAITTMNGETVSAGDMKAELARYEIAEVPK